MELSDPPFKLDLSLVETALKNIWKKKVDVKNDIEPNLFNITFSTLNKAVDDVFGKVAYNVPDFGFIQELKYNNAVFSAFKTHRQQNDLTQLLLTDGNELISFAEFKKASVPIIGKYNQQWLKTEYNTAVLRARNAATFKRFMREADLFPNLQWLPSTSIEKRGSHQVFYHKIKPLNDPFWEEHFPGNLWNCKCGITNTREPVSESGVTPKYKPAPGLDENPAITGELFSKSNTYRTNGYLKPSKLDKIAHQNASKVTYLTKVIKKFNNGGMAIESNLINKKSSDYVPLKKIAIHFANEGKIAEILPKIHFKDIKYHDIFKGAYNRKCPDLKIDGLFYEFESTEKPLNKTKVKNMLRRGLMQCDRLIIEIDDQVNDSFLLKLINDRLREGQRLNEVWVYHKEKVRLLYKNAIAK